MAPVYENYVWRLQSTDPVLDIQLPQDLEWIDELSWSPINQSISNSLSGALVIQESEQIAGRFITLQGKDDMGWIQRTLGDDLIRMRNTPSFIGTLTYVEFINGAYTLNRLHDFYVSFRHFDPPAINLESVLRFDNFEPTAWYKVRDIKLMSVDTNAYTPCT